MEKLNNLLKSKSYTVNSNKDSLTTVNSNKTVDEEIDEFLHKLGLRPEAYAEQLANALDDSSSLSYYQILVKENKPGRLFEALGYVKEAARDGKIRTKKAVYFQGVLRKWGIKTKFKK